MNLKAFARREVLASPCFKARDMDLDAPSCLKQVGKILADLKHYISAFDRGQAAGRERLAPETPNPFQIGSPEHNNFEVGRRFGASSAASREGNKEQSSRVSFDEET